MPAAKASSRTSAGVLVCRRIEGGSLELLLVHPGGPFFARKDDGVWSIPKGLVSAGEPLLGAARRELAEETGLQLPETTEFFDLGHVVQRGGKRVHAFACLGDCDPRAIVSNTFELEWPPRSGKRARFPEVDRAAFFGPDEARRKMLEAQRPFIDAALEALVTPNS